MKKRFTAIALLVLMLAFLALLGGCSAEKAPGAKEPVSEPDTDSRTVTRTIGEHQTVVYRFHTERILGLHDAEISLALFDSDADAYDHAGNWCVSRIGVVPALGQSFNTFSVGKGPDTPEDTAWKKPFWDSPPRQVGFTEIGKVKGADMALTITRSGNNMKLLLLNQIFELIMAVVLIVVLCIVGVGMMEMDKKPHVEVTTVTRIYNSSGNLVDAKYDIDYVELPEDKNK